MWAAIDDADTKELLAVYASYYYRSSINTIIFVKRVFDTCMGTPRRACGRRPMVFVGTGQDGLRYDGSTSRSATGT